MGIFAPRRVHSDERNGQGGLFLVLGSAGALCGVNEDGYQGMRFKVKVAISALPQTSSSRSKARQTACVKLPVSRSAAHTHNEREGLFSIYLGPMIVRACTCAILVAAGKLSLCSPHLQLDLLLSSSSGTNRKSNLFLPMVAAILALLVNTRLIFCRRQITCRAEYWKPPNIPGQRATR